MTDPDREVGGGTGAADPGPEIDPDEVEFVERADGRVGAVYPPLGVDAEGETRAAARAALRAAVAGDPDTTVDVDPVADPDAVLERQFGVRTGEDARPGVTFDASEDGGVRARETAADVEAVGATRAEALRRLADALEGHEGE